MFNKKRRKIKELEKTINELREELQESIIKTRQNISEIDWMPENIKAGRIVFNSEQAMRKIVDMGNDKFHLLYYSQDKKQTVLVDKKHMPEEGLSRIDLFKYFNKSEYYPFFLGKFEK